MHARRTSCINNQVEHINMPAASVIVATEHKHDSAAAKRSQQKRKTQKKRKKQTKRKSTICQKPEDALVTKANMHRSARKKHAVKKYAVEPNVIRLSGCDLVGRALFGKSSLSAPVRQK